MSPARSQARFAALFAVSIAFAFGLDALVAGGDRRAPEVQGGAFLSAGWYCPVPGDQGPSSVMATTNLSDVPVTLRRLAVGGGVEAGAVEGTVPARRRSQTPVGVFERADAVAVTEAFGAETSSDLFLAAEGRGVASSRCSVQPGNRWLFALGSTIRRQEHYLLVANPFREEAVVSVRIISPESDETPALLTNIVVPALSQSSLWLADFVPETAGFGAEVTASQGRIVASRYSVIDTREGIRGTSLALGVRGPAENWIMAGGEVPQEGEETLFLVNPGASESLVQVTFQTGAEQIAPPALEEIPIPAGRQVAMNVSDHLPRGTIHSTRVNSINKVPVVVERQMVGSVAGGFGYESVFGVPQSASRWVVPVGSAQQGQERLAILNPGPDPATVEINLYGEQAESRPAELRSIPVGAGRVAVVDLTPHVQGAAFSAVVDSSQDIAVERWLVLEGEYADYTGSPGQPYNAPS